ncbi:MAG: lipoyl(octanoyl) transferase LipB [bacterium]
MGRVPYGEALALQRALRDAVVSGAAPGGLLLLEHPPTITVGRHGDPGNIVASEGRLRELGIEVHHIERGGDVTYHGPGQLVGYPVLPISGGVQRFVRGLADTARALLAEHGVASHWRDDRPGLYTDQGKIAAVGLHVGRGVAMHGIAVNLQTNLTHYDLINPCGLPGGAVTSLQQLTGVELPLAQAAERFAALFEPPGGVTSRTRLQPEAFLARQGLENGPIAAFPGV